MDLERWIDNWAKHYGEPGLDAYLRVNKEDGSHVFKPHRRPRGMSDAAWLDARQKAADAWIFGEDLHIAQVVATESGRWRDCDTPACRRARRCIGPVTADNFAMPRCCDDEDWREDIAFEVCARLNAARELAGEFD